jgi:SAM-dependent methyltransferase
MVKVAQRLGQGISRLEVLEAPAQELPFPDDYFDLVTSTLSFHHWGDQERSLMEVCRVLSPGGALVLVDIFALSWMRPLHVLARTRDRFHTRSEVERMLDSAGLKTVSWTAVYKVAWSPVVCAVSAGKPK